MTHSTNKDNGLNRPIDIIRYKIMDNFYLSDDLTQLDHDHTTLKQTNAKLSYQRQCLLKSCFDKNLVKEEGAFIGRFSIDTLACIKYIFQKSMQKLGYNYDNPNDLLIQPSTSKTSDFQCNEAFRLKKKFQNNTTEKIANDIVNSIPDNNVIESVCVTGPGFLNINLKLQFCSHFIADIILNENVNDSKKNPIKPPGFGKKKVVVDFSSPNVAKEMHVGHLRSTIIGDCICRLYEYLGCDVARINHIGDWGTQFGMLIAYIEHKFGSLDSTSASSISDLQTFYKEAKVIFDNNETFKKKAYNMVVKLQAHDPEVINAWKMICDVSRLEFNHIYNLLDIKLTEMGESFYQDLMINTVQELTGKKLLVVDDNCKVIPMKDLNLPPLFVVKSDGGFTYDTSDLAAIKYRLQEMNAETIIYVVDNGQSDHFKAIFHAASLAGWYNNGANYPRVEHVGFGVVLGEDKKKFKTRSGDTVKLKTLLEEGVSRARSKILSKQPPIDWPDEEIDSTSEALAYSCIKYSDLSHNRCVDYVFSFDKMLEDRGNTAIYLIYAFTRIKSILRRSNLDDNQIKEFVTKSLSQCSITSNNNNNGLYNDDLLPIILEHPSEIALAKLIVKYPIVIKRMASELLPHHLCDYLYELSTQFMDFYEKCYCFNMDKNTKAIIDINMHRISLTYATGKVIQSGLTLLGLSTTIERM